MKEILPPGYEDPYVDYKGWHFIRFGFLPTPEDNNRWERHLEALGITEEIRGKLRLQIMIWATVEEAMKHANRLMSDNSDIDPTKSYTPVY